MPQVRPALVARCARGLPASQHTLALLVVPQASARLILRKPSLTGSAACLDGSGSFVVLGMRPAPWAWPEVPVRWLGVDTVLLLWCPSFTIDHPCPASPCLLPRRKATSREKPPRRAEAASGPAAPVCGTRDKRPEMLHA